MSERAAPTGNAIVERNHRTIKMIAARKRCSIDEAVHIYNATPRDGDSGKEPPAGGIYRYRLRDCVWAVECSLENERAAEEMRPLVGDFAVSDSVWVRRQGTRCTEQSQPGSVTAVSSPWVVDGTPRHVRDLQPRQSRRGGVEHR